MKLTKKKELQLNSTNVIGKLNFHTKDSLYTGAKDCLYKIHDLVNSINVIGKKQDIIKGVKDILLEVESEVEHITWAEEVINENRIAGSFFYDRVEPNCFLFNYDGHDRDNIPTQYKSYEEGFRCRIYHKTNPLISNPTPTKEWTLEVNGEKIVTSKRLLECLETHSDIIKEVRYGTYKKILWDKVDKLQKKNGFFDLYTQ